MHYVSEKRALGNGWQLKTKFKKYICTQKKLYTVSGGEGAGDGWQLEL